MDNRYTQMYAQYESELMQLEREEGISDLFDIIQKSEWETEYDVINYTVARTEEFHEVREKIEVVFQERLDLSKYQASDLFRAYSLHYQHKYELKHSAEEYQEVEGRFQECLDKDIIAKTMADQIRDNYAQSVKNEVGEVSSVGEKEIDRLEQLNECQERLARRLHEHHDMSQEGAEYMVRMFSELQKLYARQLMESCNGSEPVLG